MEKSAIGLELDFATAQVIVLVADALNDGSLNAEAPTTTARAVTAAIYGAHPSRANVLAVGDVLTRLGSWCKGYGPYPHARRMADLVAGVRAHEEQARGVKQLPLVLR